LIKRETTQANRLLYSRLRHFERCEGVSVCECDLYCTHTVLLDEGEWEGIYR